ncbi:hypothetical protein [Streptomyces sp. NPDC000888]
MVLGSRTTRSIESTAAGLQGDLDRLELQKRSLERELAAVAAHLDTVRRAVRALESVMTGPEDTASAAQPLGPRRHPAAASTPRSRTGSDTARVAPADATATSRPLRREEKAGTGASRSKKASPRKNDADSAYGQLTEQILTHLSQVGDTDVRARDVATALGRATDSGTINAVRSTLDRLVGTSRVQRTGRGLYRARQP